MNDENALLGSFKQTTYKTAGNGQRDIQVLKEAFKDVEGESDIYGKGPIIEDFQTKMAHYLGKESAVFFPSGTMAQQIALRIWCDETGIPKVAYHPLCHLEIHEEDGLKELHRIEPLLTADKDRLIQLDDVTPLKGKIACLLLELPQREIGGQLPTFETLEAISAFCHENGIKLHLDGARLFEILPYYQKTAAEICALFDSVYVSFYKGIGGIAGAILAGETEFTEKSKTWKRRHGGDLISLYPYIVSSNYYFDKRIGKMEQYFAEAKELANYYNQCEGIETLPHEPVSNMFHVHLRFPKETAEQLFIETQNESGVGLTGYVKEREDNTCYFEISLGDLYEQVPKEKVEKAFNILAKKCEASSLPSFKN